MWQGRLKDNVASELLHFQSVGVADTLFRHPVDTFRLHPALSSRGPEKPIDLPPLL